MSIATAVCPGCGGAATRRNRRDRRVRQVHQCRGWRCRFTARSATSCSGFRFPPAVIALAVRWSLRYGLRYADIAGLLAVRGVGVDASTAFAPRYEEVVRSFRRAVGSC